MSTALVVGGADSVTTCVFVGETVGAVVEPPQALTNNENAASMRRLDFLYISTSLLIGYMNLQFAFDGLPNASIDSKHFDPIL